MTEQNTVVEQQIRPNDLMSELGIKKDAYYDYLKHLDIKAEKGSDNKVYLSESQANLIRALKEHVNKTGRMDGFAALAQQADAGLDEVAEQVNTQNATAEFDIEDLVKGAAEIAGHRMTVGHQLMLQMAEQMTYEDLPDEVKTKVDSVRQATNPKHQNLSGMASDLLSQWRQKRQELQTA